MKAMNTPSRFATIKYPRNVPRVSRKRDWYDRSEWRKDPQATLEGSTSLIDQQMAVSRAKARLEGTNYEDFPDMVNRAGRVGIRRV